MDLKMKNLFVILTISLFVSNLFAQSDLSGTWYTGAANTLVKIHTLEGEVFGEIVSSDNPKAKIGKKIIKDLKQEDSNWEGKLYAAKKKEWYDAEIELKDDYLEITISVGYFSKTSKWKKVESDKR